MISKTISRHELDNILSSQEKVYILSSDKQKASEAETYLKHKGYIVRNPFHYINSKKDICRQFLKILLECDSVFICECDKYVQNDFLKLQYTIINKLRFKSLNINV